MDMLEGFYKPGQSRQEARLQKLAELSSKLLSEDARSKSKTLISRQKEMSQKFKIMKGQMIDLAGHLKSREQKGLSGVSL